MRKYPFAIALTIILVISCEYPEDRFPEYRGVNLVSSLQFENELWAIDTASPYMTFEAVDPNIYGTPPEAGGSDSVYRLAINNLVENGDFSASSVDTPPVGWIGNANTVNIVPDSDAFSIQGNTLHLIKTQIETIDYVLSDDTYGLSDGIVQDASYLIRFDYRTDWFFYVQYYAPASDNTVWLAYGTQDGGPFEVAAPDTSFTYLNAFPPSLDVQPDIIQDPPEFYVKDALADHYLSFGADPNRMNPEPDFETPATLHEMYIDNVRIMRTDVAPTLTLSMKIEDTVEPLLMGSYRFSVYIKTDPEAGTNNRYDTDAFTVGIFGGESLQQWSGNYEIYHEQNSAWDEWIRVSVEVESLQIPVSSSEVVMKLTISPTDFSHGSLYFDTGSILVANPHLEFFPDGIP